MAGKKKKPTMAQLKKAAAKILKEHPFPPSPPREENFKHLPSAKLAPEKKNKAGPGRGHKHVPTQAQRDKVTTMAGIGLPQKDMARVIGIDDETLRLHYRDELDLSEIETKTAVGGWLFQQCKAGNITALIFWAKTRLKWNETHIVENKNQAIGADGKPIDPPENLTMKLIREMIQKAEADV